jgi:hypothetical protein
LEQPIVNASMTQNADASSTNAGMLFAQNVFDNNLEFVITDKSEQGFTIVLNKPAPVDVNFSWIALAVRGAKLFSSKDPQLPLATPVLPSDMYTPPASAVVPTPAPEVAGAATSTVDETAVEPATSTPEISASEAAPAAPDSPVLAPPLVADPAASLPLP